MEAVALTAYLIYVAVAFGLRSWLQRRRTGDAGNRGLSGTPWTAEWWAGVLFAAALVAGLLAPVLAMAGLPIWSAGGKPAVSACGLVTAVGGIVGAILSQVDMGASWRIGVDPVERTDLVTTGAFAWARNPFFGATLLVAAGVALLVPNVVAAVGLVVLVVAVELQVRVVEEPYLREVHGAEYAAFAARTGRFFPRVGRIDRAG